MNPITFVYHELLFRPLFNLLVGITNVLPNHSVGLAIIMVTILVRLILLPIALHHAKQMQRTQNKMGELKAELKTIKERHKDDKAKQAEATMALYKKAGVNPASGCLPLLIQLPILLALYRVFFVGLGPETYEHLYAFVAAPAALQLTFLGTNLLQPSLIFGVIAGAAQFIQMRFFTPTPQASMAEGSEQMVASMQRNMMYIFPVMTVFIALQLPAALSLYWVVATLLAIAQQLLVKRLLHLEITPAAV